MSYNDDQIVTIRIPRSSWVGITIGIEKWAGRPREDIEILSDFEIVDAATMSNEKPGAADPDPNYLTPEQELDADYRRELRTQSEEETR